MGTRVVFSFPSGKGLTIVIAQVGYIPISTRGRLCPPNYYFGPLPIIRPSYGSPASGHPTPWEQNAPLFLWMGLNFKQLTPFLWAQAADNTYIGSIYLNFNQPRAQCGVVFESFFIAFWIVQFRFWIRLELDILD